ncbi:hypothetical protein SLEP1_g35246 [Rubroshorea leprosula]|uniref:Uncharacterized protein n=1 Tax=Rubroshorea leprosula TaxID=152421 RepID=A0AAV5KMZ1_9ROSI|nr:hypothetical protein SLEP1_g35246 [Rubroshorea leprosula]
MGPTEAIDAKTARLHIFSDSHIPDYPRNNPDFHGGNLDDELRLQSPG